MKFTDKIPNLANRSALFLICGFVVFILSFFTYYYRYDQPEGLFWDENYHIASAQKYIDGTMFMELHPPLGKMFIALGEKIVDPNKNVDKSSFNQVDYIQSLPDGYSFEGVRFFPVVFAVLSALVLYAIFFVISENPIFSFFFSYLYVFDNAIIVHSRGAMLDSTQIFFALICILAFMLIVKYQQFQARYYFLLGTLAALVMMVKMTGLVFVIFLPMLLLYDKHKELKALLDKLLNENALLNIFKSSNLKTLNFKLKTFLLDSLVKSSMFIVGFLLVTVSIWQLHFAMARHVVNDNYYNASEKYTEVLKNGKSWNPIYFPTMIKDTFDYVSDFNTHVPRLDVTKPGENGSYPITWPIGTKTINYRWETSEEGASYLYLQSNPAVWLTCLGGLILCVSLIISKFVFKLKVHNEKLFYMILSMTTLYFAYMFGVTQVGRVMYLYHYLLPLVITMILTCLIFVYIFEKWIKNFSTVLFGSLAVSTCLIIIVFYYFSPLTYYKPIKHDDFNKRIWFEIWRLQPVD